MRPRLHFIPFLPRTLCGLSDEEEEIRTTPSMLEFRTDTYRCHTCERKLTPTAPQLSLLRWLAAGNEAGSWFSTNHRIGFQARERVLDALLNRGWIRDDFSVTYTGNIVLGENRDENQASS